MIGDKMKYQSIVKQMNKNKIYTRKQIFNLILNEKPNLSNNSLKWIISDMVKNNVIYNIQRGEYSLVNNENSKLNKYIPTLNQDFINISKLIDIKYPLVDYVCFESIQLNEFLNHLIANNTLFIFVEKNISSTVFRYLQEKRTNNILYKPNIKEFDSYWKKNTIIILDLISEYPRNNYNNHVISIEQLLVDLICEKCLTYLYSKSEMENIYKKVYKTYELNYSRMYRYADRRNKKEMVKKIMEGVMNAK